MINLIIFHYHFLPGGVTDVVTSAVISYLQYSNIIDRITIVSGRNQNLGKMETKIRSAIPWNKNESLSFELLPSLDYFENLNEEVTSESITKELCRKYSASENIWWIHNYHLGKNPYFTKALLHISQKSIQKMVFHIHDFPECSRYQLLARLKQFIQDDFYPQSDNIKYSVINSRDFNYLREAGMKKESVFLLENPIRTSEKSYLRQTNTDIKLSGEISHQFPGWKSGEPYMLYPVRAIRRKNIGEAALLAALSEKNVIVTLPGVSDREKAYSEKCSRLFHDGLAPGMFAIGNTIDKYQISFDELIASSSLIVSSSIQEGFGYLFLNSMNWGKPLLARDLEILDSFKKSFKGYPGHFYRHICVPLEDHEKNEILELYIKKTGDFKNQFSEQMIKALNRQLTGIFDKEYTDFSYLTLNMQRYILRKINENPAYKTKCIKINKKIIDKINEYFLKEVTPNHKILEKNWSFESYCKKSEEILKSFGHGGQHKKQMTSSIPIDETLKILFATTEYLRLLYDE